MPGYETVFGIHASNSFKIIAHSKHSAFNKRGNQIINQKDFSAKIYNMTVAIVARHGVHGGGDL